jgi:hypothetical protein
VTGLPDTRTPGRRARPWRVVLPLVAASLLVALLAGLAPEDEDPTRGRVYSPQVEEIRVGEGGDEGTRFGAGTRTVGVQLRVRDLPSAERLAATVERSGRTSALGRLLGAGRIRAVGGPEEHLSVSEGGVSGIVAFEIRPAGGGALPAGRYAVEVRTRSRGAGDDRLLARAYFRVGG